MDGAGRTLLKLAVTVILVVLACRSIDLTGLPARFGGQSVGWVLAAALITALQIPLLAFRWQRILLGLGTDAPADVVFSVTYIGSFWTNCLFGAAAGDVARATLAPAGEAGRATIVHSVLLDRVAAFAGLALVAAPIALFKLGPLSRSIPLLAALAIAMIPCVGLFVLHHFAHVARHLRLPLSSHLVALAASWRRLRRSPAALVSIMIVSALGQVGISATAYCLARAQHCDVSLVQMLTLMPPVVLVTALPISAAGWGVRENAMVVAMAAIGVASASALLISVQLGLLAALMSLPGGAVWLLQGSKSRDAVRQAA